MADGILLQRPLENEYRAIQRFTEEYDGISYLQLDNYTVEKVNLFAIPEYERFSAMEQRLDKITAALPALKRIFANPITRLKDVEAVLPVDAVRVIDHSTMRHVSLHTEFWGNITDDSLIPRKLLTTVNEEEYKIYENVAFAQLITTILNYVKANIHLCKNVIYSSRPMNFDLMERRNHLMHFLALGKLHVGYANTQDSYHQIYSQCLEKLLYIDRSLRSKLGSPVYRICKKDKSKLTLKRTNIFRSQKDYKQVYNLLKLFGEDDTHTQTSDSAIESPTAAYVDFCTLLTLFSAKHFNFGFDEQEKLHFGQLDTTCRFKAWSLKIQRFKEEDAEALRIQIEKEKSYSVCLLFPEDGKCEAAVIQALSKSHPSDEFLIAQNNARGIEKSIYLDLFDIDSFRRIQQLILRCMIYSDTERTICPFCGAPLSSTSHNYECARCKTVIDTRLCPDQNAPYFAVTLKDYRPASATVQQQIKPSAENLFFKERAEEALLFFRNITPISKTGDLICPKCGKVH